MTGVDAPPTWPTAVGTRALRRNGPALLCGRGSYLADHRVPGLHEIDRIADRRPSFYAKIVEPNGRE